MSKKARLERTVKARDPDSIVAPDRRKEKPDARRRRLEGRGTERAILPAELREALDDFLVALRAEAGAARNTLIAYASDLEHFFGYAVERKHKTLARIDPELVVDYLSWRRASGASEATVARNLAAVRMCLRHLVAAGALKGDPTALLSSPKLGRALPGTLSPEDVERLLGLLHGVSDC